MNFLIKEILHYTQVGKVDIEVVKIDMQPLLNEIKDEVTINLTTQNLESTIGETPGIFGDKTMITKVFSNLLNNAVKYSARTDGAKVKVAGIVDQNEITYTVTDNGLGIGTKYVKHIFSLFKRMDNVKRL